MPKRLFSAVCGMWWLSFSSSHLAASHRPRTQPPRHHTRAHSWCTPWLAVSCGRLRSSPWLHTFTAAHARCSDLFRSGPTCGTKVDNCIRATAPAYLLLELLSLVCGLGRQEQLAADHECITCMPAESNALRARGDGATASRPHLHQPTRALLVSARTASPGDAASARRRSRTRAVNGTRALRSISVAASGSAERRVPNALARVHLTAPPQAQSPQATPEHRQRSCSGGWCIVARGV